MISIIIERSGPQMTIIGVYPGYTSSKTRETANNIIVVTPGVDIDVLEFDTYMDLNKFLLTEAGFIS